MKVLLINGSPRDNGNTSLALQEVARTLNAEGIDTETVNLGRKAVQGCSACGMCGREGRCTFRDELYYKVWHAVKEGMPVIRYLTRDLCCLMDGQCDCGRTSIRMGRIQGRSDDMLIIRGINVFPSQVESVVLSMPEFAPHYLLVVDRVNNLDTLQVQVEIRQEYFTGTFDTPAAVDALEKKLASKLKSVLSISAKVQLKAPGTIERSQGKSAHVVDNRKL